jgi:predicted Zn-dependent protease
MLVAKPAIALCLLLLSAPVALGKPESNPSAGAVTSSPASTAPAAVVPTPTPLPSREATSPASTVPPSTAPAPTEDAVKTPPAKTSEELARFQKLAAADALYREGKLAEAATLYRQVKDGGDRANPSLSGSPTPPESPEDTGLLAVPSTPVLPMVDAEQLSPAGRVYWREAQAGMAQKLESRTQVPLKLLVEKHPEFIPGSLALAQVEEEAGHLESASRILEQLSGQFPDQPDLLRARIALLGKTEQWMDASIAARQYALLYPEAQAAAEFTQLANANLKRYQKQIRSKITGNLIGGIVTGVVGYAVTGSIWGPLSSVQTSLLLLRGESAVGDRYARQVQRRLDMVQDEAILSYVNEIGQKLAKASGRTEFKYEFYVILDDRLNAFALPGGKVFVNAGAIAKANSEAELAGLLAHELSHAVLSHGFQMATSGSFTANVFQFVPLGGLATDLIVLGYSRKMERQADTLGTRMLAASGYAADGLRNLMVTLGREDKRPPALGILSSHPATATRVRELDALIIQGSYNRYAYEGVERHARVQAQVQKLLDEKKARDEQEDERQKDERRRRREREDRF